MAMPAAGNAHAGIILGAATKRILVCTPVCRGNTAAQSRKNLTKLRSDTLAIARGPGGAIIASHGETATSKHDVDPRHAALAPADSAVSEQPPEEARAASAPTENARAAGEPSQAREAAQPLLHSFT